MISMDLITSINSAIVLLFCALSAYQYLYILVSIFFQPRRFKASTLHRYAVLICARNEEAVVGNLIDSVKRQNYPESLIDVYVLADNCDDNTRGVSEAAGAIVYERHDKQKVGKGYALDYLLRRLIVDRGETYYDGYFVLDADNLISSDYVAKMNAVFDSGYRVVTSYRNSKNFSTNWITAGYGLMFMKEARHMNNARMILHTSCAISGTGFLVHRDVVNEKGGWPYYLLTEDLEFTMERISAGEKIGYCHDAMFYDEQPVTFRQSWHQRMRWSKGFLQAFMRHGGSMIRGVFRKRSGFSCFDEIMNTLPTVILSFFAAFSIGSMVYGAVYNLVQKTAPWPFLESFVSYILGIYVVNLVISVVTTITEWNKISCPASKKILYIFTYPIFMMSNIPITLASIFARAKWHPVLHGDRTRIEEIETHG